MTCEDENLRVLFYIYIEKALILASELMLWFRALKSLLGTFTRQPFRMELRPTAELLFVHVFVVVVEFANLVHFPCCSRLFFGALVAFLLLLLPLVPFTED